jgi:hypothetical protein
MSGLPIMWNPKEWCDSGAVGELVPNCEAKIMDDEGVTLLPDGERGELWCRAPTVMKGYWQNHQATKDTVTEDGWLKTGDIAIRDSHGKYLIVDRKKVRTFCGLNYTSLILGRNSSKLKAYRLLRLRWKLCFWNILRSLTQVLLESKCKQAQEIIVGNGIENISFLGKTPNYLAHISYVAMDPNSVRKIS